MAGLPHRIGITVARERRSRPYINRSSAPGGPPVPVRKMRRDRATWRQRRPLQPTASWQFSPATYLGSECRAIRTPGPRIARGPPRPCGARLSPRQQVRLPVKGLTAKTLESRSAPDAREFCQGRGCGAISAGGQEVSGLSAVEPTFKFCGHIGPHPSHSVGPRQTRALPRKRSPGMMKSVRG